jgi:cytochrome c553
MRRLRPYALLVAIAAPLVAILAVVVILSGVISIKASSRHWAITSWVLDFVKRRSVATHSIGIEVPPLDDPALVLRGAGHYESGCRTCHGSPEVLPPRIPQGMTPHPPDLRAQVARWKPQELFYIVKHGIKFTGMPAWPAPERDDEVWAMVAFLRVLPRMGAGDYARLVFGGLPRRENVIATTDLAGAPSAIARFATESCGRCHGREGQGRESAAFPRLAGQRPEYSRRALQAYGGGGRQSGVMAPIAAGLGEELMQRLADYYATLTPAMPPAEPADASASRGAEIATRGLPAQRVPACAQCHGPAASERNPAYPSLAGQFPAYAILQLQLFSERKRGGSAFAHLHDMVGDLTADQKTDVARYYERLPAGSDR